MIEGEENWRTDALREKEKGNECFKKGEYVRAIEHYSNAITFDGSNELLFGNRAQCYINLNMFLEAENDCSHALRLNDKFVKGYFRRGIARKLQRKNKEAFDDFKTALKLEPTNKQTKLELDAIKKTLGLTNEPMPAAKSLPSKPSKLNQEAMDIDGDSRTKTYVVTLPKHIPSTSYQFYCDWRELKKENGNDLKLEYIMKIGASVFAKIFDLSIEPEVFTEILFVLDLCSDFEFVFSLLSNFTRTTRFGSLILFLSDPEKEMLKKLFTKVVENGKYSEDEVKQIAGKYHIR